MFFTWVWIDASSQPIPEELLLALSTPYRNDEQNTLIVYPPFKEVFEDLEVDTHPLQRFHTTRTLKEMVPLLPLKCGRIFVLSTECPSEPPEAVWKWSDSDEDSDEEENITLKPFTCVRRVGRLHQYHLHLTQEQSYLSLVQTVRDHGEIRTDRTGTGVRSVFGPQIEFNLEEGFPLLTTKRVPFDKVVHEVMWYLSGDTHTSYLRANRVFVWDDNTSRAFLDARGLTHYKVGETGPLYGFQWRHFGGDPKDLAQRPGVDQLSRLLQILRSDPTSRRMFLSAWNPTDLEKMCLEPCHVSFQLYVRNGTHLDGKLYLRSNDLFLGAPWNIAAYALLLMMFAHLSGYTPGKLIYTLGDAHLYLTHLSQVEEMLHRPLRPLPRVRIVDPEGNVKGWDDFSFEHFQLEGYTPHPPIVARMAV